MANYRYFRVRITKVRAGSGSVFPTQIGEWNFLNGGSRVAPSALIGLHPGDFGDNLANIDDNNTSNKMFALDYHATQVVWDFGSSVAIDGYRWYTANDADTRDPLSWVIEASDDPAAWWWTQVSTVTDYATTTSRNTLVNTWSIAPPSPDTPPTPSGQAGRYWRFTPTARRGGGTNDTQYCEFHMMANGLRRPSTSQSSPSGQGANADDWTVSTKLYSGTLANSVVTLDLGSSLTCDEYLWYTGDDASDRDPVSWTVERSDDGSSWTLVDTVTSATITTERRAYAYAGAISAPLGTTLLTNNSKNVLYYGRPLRLIP